MDDTDDGRNIDLHNNEGRAEPAVPPSDVPGTSLPAELDASADEAESDVVEADYREILDDPRVQDLVARFLSRSERTTGSVPPPSFLRQYEAIRPGAADLVFERYELEGQMAAREQAHRHAMDIKLSDHDIAQDRQALNEGIASQKRGQIFGFWLAALFLAAAVLVMIVGMLVDQPWVAGTGGAAIIAEVVGLVLIFTRQVGRDSKEAAQAQQANTGSPSRPAVPELPAPGEPQQESAPTS